MVILKNLLNYFYTLFTIYLTFFNYTFFLIRNVCLVTVKHSALVYSTLLSLILLRYILPFSAVLYPLHYILLYST